MPNVATVWGEDQKTTEIDGTSLWGLYNLIDPEAIALLTLDTGHPD